MSRSAKAVIVAFVAVAVLLLSALPSALRKAAERRRLRADLDRVAEVATSTLTLTEQMLRGWADESYEKEMARIAEQAREEARRLSAGAEAQHSSVHQDLANWATAIAQYGDAAKRLGPPPGKPGYVDWQAKIKQVESRLATAQAEAYDPELLARRLADLDEQAAQGRSTGVPPGLAAQVWAAQRQEAREEAHDTLEGQAARQRVESLRKELADLEAHRPLSTLDLEPYQEKLNAASELAIQSVEIALAHVGEG